MYEKLVRPSLLAVSLPDFFHGKPCVPTGCAGRRPALDRSDFIALQGAAVFGPAGSTICVHEGSAWSAWLIDGLARTPPRCDSRPTKFIQAYERPEAGRLWRDPGTSLVGAKTIRLEIRHEQASDHRTQAGWLGARRAECRRCRSLGEPGRVRIRLPDQRKHRAGDGPCLRRTRSRRQ